MREERFIAIWNSLQRGSSIHEIVSDGCAKESTVKRIQQAFRSRYEIFSLIDNGATDTEIAELMSVARINVRFIRSLRRDRKPVTRSPVPEELPDYDTPRSATLRPIGDFPGYFAGDDGHIYSSLRSDAGAVPDRLRRSSGEDGNFVVCLFRDGRRVRLSVPRLIAEAFIGQCPDQCVATVIGDKKDLRPRNIEYRARNSRLSNDEVRAILSDPRDNETIANVYRIGKVAVSNIRTRRTHKHVAPPPKRHASERSRERVATRLSEYPPALVEYMTAQMHDTGIIEMRSRDTAAETIGINKRQIASFLSRMLDARHIERLCHSCYVALDEHGDRIQDRPFEEAGSDGDPEPSGILTAAPDPMFIRAWTLASFGRTTGEIARACGYERRDAAAIRTAYRNRTSLLDGNTEAKAARVLDLPRNVVRQARELLGREGRT